MASASGSPGTGGLNGCNKGPFINEFSDGSFVVECASEEEEKAVRSGKITMQR